MFRMLLPAVALSACFILPPTVVCAAQAAKPTPPTGSSQSSPIVNLNSATARELEILPGIGTKTAIRIVEYRDKNGPFKKIEDLMNVQGIGEKSFLKLRPQLTVSTKPAGSNARTN